MESPSGCQLNCEDKNKIKLNKVKTFGINPRSCRVCKSKNSNLNRLMDTLSESPILVGFGVFRKRSVFFLFFFLTSRWCRAPQLFSWLWGSQRAWCSLSCSSVHQLHWLHTQYEPSYLGGSANFPVFHVFAAPVIFAKRWLVWLWYTLIHDQTYWTFHSSGLCAPCARLFVFLFVLFHKGHELVWSTVMAERALYHGWRATDLRPCFLSCSWEHNTISFCQPVEEQVDTG